MFSRLGNLIKGFFSLFISGMEKRNPEALLELEQENLRKQIANFNQGLATHAGLCERIMGQVRKLEAEQKDLRAKTAAHLRAGNKSAAGQYALRLQTIEAQLEENRKQLEQAEATYKNLVKARDVAVQTARAKIESLKGAINDMRMNQAMAEIHEMASGMISQHRRRRRHAQPPARDGRRRAHQGRRPRPHREGLDRHDRRRRQGSRDDRARRPGARRLRRARRHLAAGRSRRLRPAARTMGADSPESRLSGSARCELQMPAPQGAPAWANELALAYESGAHGQFILYGNVHDRHGGRHAAGQPRRATSRTICSPASPSCSPTTSATGSRSSAAASIVEKWGGADLKALPREPLPAIQYVSRYLRYLGNLRALGREVKEHVAVILRGVDQIVPADGAGFEHGSLTSVLREWSSEAPFCELPFTSILIADNLNDVEPLVAFSAHVSRIRVPLPDAQALERALALLQVAAARSVRRRTQI